MVLQPPRSGTAGAAEDGAASSEFETAGSAELARLLRAERVMVRIRWGGVAFGLVQVLTYYLPYPPGMLVLALALVALLATGNVVVWWVLPRATTLARARRLSVAALSLNAVAFVGLVFVYTFDVETAIWALLYVLPMEAAIRFQLRGAMWTIAALTVAYTARELFGTLVYGNPFLVVSITFRMGVGLIIASVAGVIAQSLTRDREQLAALSGITREVATATSGQDVLDGAVRRISALLRARTVTIALADDDRLTVRARASSPGHDHAGAAGRMVGDPVRIDGPVADALRAGRARVVAEQAGSAARDRWRPWRRRAGGGLLLAPLQARGEVLGLVLAETGGRDRFSGAELALVETVAGQLAGALISAGLHEQARDARAAADRANEAKSAFLANMSHEIRTPMNAVLGVTELLRATALTGEQDELVGIVEHSGENLLAIIDDVLDFSKIEAGRLELERIPLDPRSCLEGALDVLAPRAAAAGIDLVGVVAPGLPGRVSGDPVRLRQVLVNLVGNAVKFTERGEVVASLHPGREPGRIRVSVADTGVGIPPDWLDRLFRSFSQVDVSTTRRHGGTGLGLAISQRLVGLMGGRIEVDSAVGRGTTFAFEADLPAAPDAPDPATPALAAGRRVLLVVGTASRRDALAEQCAHWGFAVDATGSSEDACSRLEAGARYDVVLADDPMGGRGAGDVVGSAAARGVPVIALSPLGIRPTPDQASARLRRPVTHAALVAALDRVSGVAVDAPSPGSDAEAPPRSLRILLAEDHPVNRTLALRLLETLGHGADVAVTGLEVLAALEVARYDVVLMDVQMPELDGLEAARRIVAAPGVDRPWLVAVTANAMAGDREMCLAAGMDDYLAKPIRLAGLAAALGRVPVRATTAGSASARPDEDVPEQHAAVAEPRSEPDTPEWDPSTLRELAGSFGPDGADVVAELVDAAADELPRVAARLRAAHHAGDVAEVRRAAHALKSTAATLGAPALARRCRDVETGAAEPDELAGRVERDATELVARLRAVRIPT